MKINFNKTATQQNMVDFRLILQQYLKNNNISKDFVLDLKKREIYFTVQLTHEEDSIILVLLGRYSSILETKLRDHLVPQ